MRADRLLVGMAVVGIGAVGAALVTQHVFGMQPCAWCVLQRLIFLSIAAAAVLGLLWRAPLGRRVGAGLALALAACGVSAALWQHFVAASSASCDLSLAERIVGATGLDGRFPEVFMAMASCAEAAVKLGGLPYEFWSLGLFVGLGATALAVLRRP
jgi:disulfide bond formation protein DsbB